MAIYPEPLKARDRDDVWQSAMFQAVLTGGVNWVLGRAKVDVTPNLDRVAPQANMLPQYVAPPAK